MILVSLMKNLVLPSGEEHPLSFYLAMEDYAAEHLMHDVFFVWKVEPTVIIGRNQILENEVNLDYCREKGVKIVRRKSGGGCVYADKGNIMISMITGRGDVREVFDRYLSALVSALKSLGLDAYKSGRNDVMVDGCKISGNAFHQLPEKSIVHGTLLYSVDMDALTEAILPPVEKLERHGVESVRQRVRNLSDYSQVHPSLGSVEALMSFLTDFFVDGVLELTEQQVKEIEESALSRYNTET